MRSAKSPYRFELNSVGERSDARRGYARLSIRFRRGPVVAIISAALVWVGLVAAAWWLL